MAEEHDHAAEGVVEGSTLLLKLGLIVVMVVVTIVFGLLPMRILKMLRQRAASTTACDEELATSVDGQRWPSVVLCLLTCLSGGVFLGAAFLNLLPEVTEHLQEIKESRGWEFDYPVGELLSMIGFFLVFFLEEVVLSLIPAIGHRHGGHHGAEKGARPTKAITRGMSPPARSKSADTEDGKKPENNHWEDSAEPPVQIVQIDSDNSLEVQDVAPRLRFSKGVPQNEDEPVINCGSCSGPLLNTTATNPKYINGRGVLNARSELSAPADHRKHTASTGCLDVGGSGAAVFPTPHNTKHKRSLPTGPSLAAIATIVRRRIYSEQTSEDDGGRLWHGSPTSYGSLSCLKNGDALAGSVPKEPQAATKAVHHWAVGRSIETELFSGVELAEPERCEVDTCEGRDEDPPILMVSRPHAHSHGVRSMTLVLALSFHSILEGLAFGVQRSVDDVGVLFVSLMVHKSVVAFSVGLQLGRTHAHALGWVIVSIVLLAFMSPIGAIVGLAVQESSMESGVKDIIVVTFEGLAVGTFIYVTFFEILIHERDNEHPNLLKLLFLVIGFSIIGVVRLLEGSHHHSTGLGHSESAMANSTDVH